jgi:transcriptional regulator with XRE-family HTH domain
MGKALRTLRIRCGLTQAQAAQKLRTQPSEISRWENEEVRMNLESLERVLTAYEATLHDLADQTALQRGGGRGEEDRAMPSDAELLRSLTEAIRRVEGRVERLERQGDDGPA